MFSTCHPQGDGKVVGTINGKEVDILYFFSDELSFTGSEFDGLTIREAQEHKWLKDVAYLQS